MPPMSSYPSSKLVLAAVVRKELQAAIADIHDSLHRLQLWPLLQFEKIEGRCLIEQLVLQPFLLIPLSKLNPSLVRLLAELVPKQS